MIKSFKNRPARYRPAISLFTVALVAAWQLCAAQSTTQQTFPSAEAASAALFNAAESQDASAMRQILGPNPELISSNDASQDAKDREQFARKYRQMHRLVRQRNGAVVLYIGAENWPFPVPIEARNGVWQFDADAGQQEVLYRQIGEGELTAIETCRGLAAASKPQTHADADSPVGGLFDSTRAGSKPVQFQGYYFRILPHSDVGAVRVVAYPVDYGRSGVMTFFVDAGGSVYEKDLGPATATKASTMHPAHVDSSWKLTETTDR